MKHTILFCIPFIVGMCLGAYRTGLLATVIIAFILSFICEAIYNAGIPTIQVSKDVYTLLTKKAPDGVIRMVELSEDTSSNSTNLQ